MFRNYLLISFRNLRKHFSYSLINIFGLGMGLATCLLLVVWIQHELSYDQFHQNASRIYRASLEMNFRGQSIKTSVSPTALLPALNELPEVKSGVRVYNPSSWNPYIVKRGDNLFQEQKFYFADSTFFDVFSFELLKGNPASALVEPNSVILTEKTARKYFSEEDPMGKTLTMNNTTEYTVTGVIKDAPSNSFLQFDLIGSFNSLWQAKEQPHWWSANYQTFVVLDAGADVALLNEKIDQVANKAVGSDLSSPEDHVHYHFMKLTDIHLRSPFQNEFEVVGNIDYVYIFSAIAILILLIACINYINLATARAADRAKEVGVRKVVGAVRKQLFIQFMSESALITLMAFVVAFFIAQVGLPIFNSITGKALSGSIFYTPGFLAYSLLTLVIIAVLAGAYPALVITSFKPVSILRGNFKFSGRGIVLRQVLVVTQFCISVMLIVGTIVIFKQLSFIQQKTLGYQKENVIIMPLDRKTKEVYNQLKTEFVRNANAVSVGVATESPTRIQGGYGFNITNQNGAQELMVTAVATDTGFISALNMKMLAGRNFTDGDFQRVAKDTLYSFIVNESLLKSLYIEPENAIGKSARLSGRNGQIVGVVSDFHFSTLHSPIGPLVLFSQEDYNLMFVRVESNDIEKSLTSLKKITAQLTPHRPFEYQFLDEQYDAMYSSEQKMGSIFMVFATLAILIACLGLLGLVSFSAAQKTKEIGIRKVLGATATNIVVLITQNFTSLVLVAILIGIPASYWIMERWLGGFAYRTEIGVVPVAVASLVCLLIAFGTAGYQAVKAAMIDPSKTLRND